MITLIGIVGLLLVIVAVCLIYFPAGLIVAGVLLFLWSEFGNHPSREVVKEEDGAIQLGEAN